MRLEEKVFIPIYIAESKDSKYQSLSFFSKFFHFTKKDVAIYHPETNESYAFTEIKKEDTPHWMIVTAKIIACCTIVIPIVMAVGYLMTRSQRKDLPEIKQITKDYFIKGDLDDQGELITGLKYSTEIELTQKQSTFHFCEKNEILFWKDAFGAFNIEKAIPIEPGKLKTDPVTSEVEKKFYMKNETRISLVGRKLDPLFSMIFDQIKDLKDIKTVYFNCFKFSHIHLKIDAFTTTHAINIWKDLMSFLLSSEGNTDKPRIASIQSTAVMASLFKDVLEADNYIDIVKKYYTDKSMTTEKKAALKVALDHIKESCLVYQKKITKLLLALKEIDSALKEINSVLEKVDSALKKIDPPLEEINKEVDSALNKP